MPLALIQIGAIATANWIGFVGSVLGGVAAAVVLATLAAGASFAGQFMGGATLGTTDLVVLALIPLALTALATWVARAAVLATLRTAV